MWWPISHVSPSPTSRSIASLVATSWSICLTQRWDCRSWPGYDASCPNAASGYGGWFFRGLDQPYLVLPDVQPYGPLRALSRAWVLTVPQGVPVHGYPQVDSARRTAGGARQGIGGHSGLRYKTLKSGHQVNLSF